MPEPAGPTELRQSGFERLFPAAVILVALVIGAGFGLFYAALKRHEARVAAQPGLVVEDAESRLIAPDHARRMVEFTLTDSSGRAVTRSELDGKILVVDFLFTSCSLTCPAVNREMAKIQGLTSNQPDVKLISLTVDPRDDTPAVLETYSKRFGADANRWLFLTGDREQLYHLIGTSFLAKDSVDNFSYMPGNFAHTERIAIVDAQGNLRGFFDGLNQNTAAAAVAEIAGLRTQNP